MRGPRVAHPRVDIGNSLLVVVIVNLSKELKVEGVSLKTMNGGSVSTHGQKNVFDVTLTVSGRRLADEQGSGNIQEPVAQVTCNNVLLARVSSIENGDDESLVKITVGDGIFWEPRMSAASYHLHENSFGIDQLYLQDMPAVFYDVNCDGRGHTPTGVGMCVGRGRTWADRVMTSYPGLSPLKMHSTETPTSTPTRAGSTIRKRGPHTPTGVGIRAGQMVIVLICWRSGLGLELVTFNS